MGEMDSMEEESPEMQQKILQVFPFLSVSA